MLINEFNTWKLIKRLGFAFYCCSKTSKLRQGFVATRLALCINPPHNASSPFKTRLSSLYACLSFIVQLLLSPSCAVQCSFTTTGHNIPRASQYIS